MIRENFHGIIHNESEYSVLIFFILRSLITLYIRKQRKSASIIGRREFPEYQRFIMTAERGKYVFTWHIENISLCPLENSERLCSPNFKIENLGKWFITLYPRGRGNPADTDIACFLINKGPHNLNMDFSLEMIGQNGEILKCFIAGSWGLPDSLPIDLLNEKVRNEDTLTVRCQIMRKNEMISRSAWKKVAVTKIGVHRCCFMWEVDILNSSAKENIREIFFSGESQLKLIFSCNDDIKIKIQKTDEESTRSQLVSCKISLIDRKGKEIASEILKHLFSKNSDQTSLDFPAFFSKKDLLERKWDLKQDYTLTLKCEVSASTGENWSEITSIRYENPKSLDTLPMETAFSTLQQDLRNMLKTRKNADIKFQIENLTIPAHKNILSARSPVFCAMFDQDMKESQIGIVTLEDLDAETLNSLLEFIYTGCLSELNFENAMKLLVASDKYQISSLTEKCAEFVMSQLAIENVCEVYVLSDMINHKDLKTSAYKFIDINSLKILESDAWSEWMEENVKLANEILFKLALDSRKRNVCSVY